MRTLAVVLVLIASSFAGTPKGNVNSFVLDTTKPYVYLAFDHAGAREPVFPGESSEGIWMRIVNNCKQPATIGTFDPGNGGEGVGVLYDVVPIPISGSGGIPSLPGDTEYKPQKAPEGYASTASVHSTMTVAPGKSVLFSIPSNHLSRNWFIRVEFTLGASTRGDQPYSYAEYRWERLPSSLRATHK